MKVKKSYICKECGYKASGWMGKCPNCGAWDSIEEKAQLSEKSPSLRGQAGDKPKRDFERLRDIKLENNERIFSGISEFDRTLGGGLVRDSVTILTAVPGAGKSTLLLELSIKYAERGLKVLYISGEESGSQIKSRAQRISGQLPENIWIISTSILDEGIAAIDEVDPDIIFLDSIQTVRLLEFNSKIGSPVQTVECTSKLIEICKNPARPRAAIMVGHMTKADEMAGLRTLEHMVDTVIVLREDLDQDLRMLYSNKNRFGRTGEVGILGCRKMVSRKS